VEELLVVVAVAAVVLIVSAPLRGGAQSEDRRAIGLAELQAAKESKYREIRDAELDFRTGKLSEEDWRGLDRQLRAEAVAILRELDSYDS
jgi:hypothetical protein